jgi:hypothetical protein
MADCRNITGDGLGPPYAKPLGKIRWQTLLANSVGMTGLRAAALAHSPDLQHGPRNF